jgi:hypothetical protein
MDIALDRARAAADSEVGAGARDRAARRIRRPEIRAT